MSDRKTATMTLRNSEGDDAVAAPLNDSERLRVYFDEATGLAYRNDGDGTRPYVGRLHHVEEDRVVVELDGTGQ